LQGVPPLGGDKQPRGRRETSYFEAKCVNISTTAADTSKVTINDYNSKLHISFRLTPRSMTLDDLELFKFEFSENFSGFSDFGRNNS